MAAHAKSVMEGGIRKRKFAKRSTKNAVASPYSLHWPLLKDDHQEIIVNEIVNTLEDFESESFQREPTAQAENCKETENRLPEKQKGNTEKTMPRSSLVIGLNEVIRGLEKGNLVLVLVEKSIKPVSLLEHLIVLCATRNTAACALTSISETKIPKVLKVRRVAALGLKKLHAPVFDNLVDFIKSSAPPLHVPWLHTTEKNQGMSNEDGQNKNKKKQLFENTSEPLEKVQQQMSTAQPVTNTGTQLVGESTDNKILEKTREPENLKLQETGKATSQEELIVKKKKKRKRHSKQKTEKDSTPQLAYMKPCVKTYDTTPKDTLRKRKGRKCQ